MKTILTAALAALLAAPAAAQKPPKPVLPPLAQGSGGGSPGPWAGRNVKVSFKVQNGVLAGAGNLVLEVGTQANYVVGGEKPHEAANRPSAGVEFKKYGTIFNTLVSSDGESDQVLSVQMQVEVSGPLEPIGGLKVPPLETFQYQATFTARLGRPVVLVDEPARRVEVLVEAAPAE